MQIQLTVMGDGAPAAMRSLKAWLEGEDKLRGSIQRVVAAPQPGTMGSIADVLTAALGHDGAVAAMASVLISWIRRQTGKISVRVSRPDGAEVTLNANHVRGLSPDEISSVVTRLETVLNEASVRK